MRTQVRKIWQPFVVGTAVVALMASFAALAYASDWSARHSLRATIEIPADEAQPLRCPECGVVESVRRIAPGGTVLASYEITVRMPRGANRIVTDTTPATWRAGERIILIEGRK
jgi:hypothetical protein